jgi:hypothetical protein
MPVVSHQGDEEGIETNAVPGTMATIAGQILVTMGSRIGH